MKNLLLTALLALCAATAAAQCNTFDCAYKEAQRLLNSTEKDKYTKAMAHLEDAENYAGADKAQYEKVRVLRKKAFVAIEGERKAAVEARQEATRLVEQKADSALQKANKLIKAFYFYGERFALAYGKKGYGNVFYFIDKNGDEVQKLGRWEKAEQFDGRGFAKVKKQDDNQNYILDTFGQIYPVAYDVKNLKPETLALDLSRKQLKNLPEEVFGHSQLKVVLLGNNHTTGHF
jgi:ABC-type amino acid transport substrate-binding protein